MEYLQLLRIGSVLGGVGFVPTGRVQRGLGSSFETELSTQRVGGVRKCHLGEVSAPEVDVLSD